MIKRERRGRVRGMETRVQPKKRTNLSRQGRPRWVREIHNAVAGRLRHPPASKERAGEGRGGRGALIYAGRGCLQGGRTGANNSLASASTGHPLLSLDPETSARREYFLLRLRSRRCVFRLISSTFFSRTKRKI